MFLSVTCAVALGEQTPGRGKLLPTAAGLGFARAAAVRMVHRITGNTTVNRPDAAMAGAPGFAEDHVFVLGIANLANSGVAIFVDAADFHGGKANLRIAFVTGHQSRSATGSKDHLIAETR